MMNTLDNHATYPAQPALSEPGMTAFGACDSQFLDHARAVLRNASTNPGSVAIVLVRIQGFDELCVHYPSNVLEELLRTFETRLRSFIPAATRVAASGGGKFALLLASDSTSGQIEQNLVRLRALTDLPVDTDGGMVRLDAAAGVSLFPDDGREVDQLIRNADLASSVRGRSAGMKISRYQASMRRELDARLQVESALRGDLAQLGLNVAYQPIMHLKGTPFVDFEVLVRWRHPELGPLDPEYFVGVAERAGLVSQLGEWVVCRALRDLASLREHVSAKSRISVNVSGSQLVHETLDALLMRMLAGTGHGPRDVIVELTESALATATDVTVAGMRRARELGARIAIDDFGAGYSSLNRLCELPCDILKIDKSFLQHEPTGIVDTQLFRELVAIGRARGLRVVAEGVETATQLELVSAAGCDGAQGYMLSPPAAIDEFMPPGRHEGKADRGMPV